MSFPIREENQDQIQRFQALHAPQSVTIVCVEMVSSNQIRVNLGDQYRSELSENFHQTVRTLLSPFANAQEFGTTDHAFLIVFILPSEAVCFALQLQHRLKSLSSPPSRPLISRIGLHWGDVIIERHETNHKLTSIQGISVDLCARIASLAGANQILMSPMVFDLARQALKGQDIAGIGAISWLNYGPYNFSGVDEPIIICEVGEVGLALLSTPQVTELIVRPVFQRVEPVLGWRPAVGLEVPKTVWLLEKKIGEGGFGEVWLACHKTLGERKAFKFCFFADRVRSLKREVVLFRILKENFGNHPHIVPLLDVNFEEPPYYIVMDYIPNKDLNNWFNWAGNQSSLELRLEIVAQAAEGLQAAHNAGIIHRDIKPSNILIQEDPLDPHNICIKLTDFGIGQVLSPDIIKDLTSLGMSRGLVSDEKGSFTGTPMYMSPELWTGARASINSDLYSLGIVLYQLIIGDMSKPLTTDWPESIHDELLREDLKSCFASDASQRFSSAIELARNLRTLNVRRQHVETETRLIFAARRRKAMGKSLAVALVILVFISLALGIGLTRVIKEKENAKTAEKISQEALQQALKAQNETRAAQITTQDALTHTQAAETLAIGALSKVKETLSLTDFIQAREYLDKGCEAEAVAYLSRSLRNNPGNQSAMMMLFATLSWYGFPRLVDEFSTGMILDCVMPSASQPLVALNQDGVILWFSPRTPTAVRQQPLQLNGKVFRGRLIEELKQAVTVNLYNEADLWEITSGKPLTSPVSFKNFVEMVSFDRHGTKLAVAFQNTAAVWDMEKKLPITDAFIHQEPLRILSLSPDANLLFTVTVANIGQLWSVHTGKLLASFPFHHVDIKAAVFNPDASLLAIAYERHIQLLETPSGILRHDIVTPWQVVELVSFSHDGKQLAAYSHDGSVRIWELPTCQSTIAPVYQTQPIDYLSFNTDGTHVITGLKSGVITVWETPHHQGLVPSLTRTFLPITWCWQSDKIILAIPTPDNNTLELVNADTGKTVYPPFIHHSGLRTAAFSPSGAWIATGNDSMTVRLWNVMTQQESPWTFSHDDYVTILTFSADNQKLATGSWDKTVRIWNMSDGRIMGVPLVHPVVVKAVAFSPDGNQLLTGGGDSQARLWSLVSVTQPLLNLIHDAPVTTVGFSPDGELIATAACDRTVRIWRTRGGAPQGKPLRHEDVVDVLCFSPNGTAIATGTQKGIAQIWDIATGQPLTLPFRHNDRLIHLAFRADGSQLLTTSADRQVKIWDIGIGVSEAPVWLSDLAESIAGVRLTEQSTLEKLLKRERQAPLPFIANQEANHPAIKWAKWLLEEDDQRAASPYAY